MTSLEPQGRRTEALATLLELLVSSKLVTSVTAAIGSADRIIDVRSAGEAATITNSLDGSDAIYDFASLTKPFSSTLALHLHEQGELDLRMTLGAIWSDLSNDLEHVMLSQLLSHQAGFQAWVPLYTTCDSSSDITRYLLEESSLGATAGTYSDLGYILWGMSAEKVLDRDLSHLFRKWIFPMSANRSLQTEPGQIGSAMMCGLDTDVEQGLARDQGLDIDILGPPARGRVQDGNARFCGGLGAHAGLFGTALDLWELGRRWLLPEIEPTLANFEMAGGGSESYGLGWAGKSISSSAGDSLSNSSFGHTGFTGSSLWIDPELGLVLALATHRRSTQVDLQPWRRQFHRLVVGNNSATKTVI